MEEEMDEDTLHALALSMQEWQGDQQGDATQPQPATDGAQDMEIDHADLQQALALSMQDHEAQDEPAPPPDTEMLTNDTVPHANQSTSAANNHLPMQQQASQAQQPSAAPDPSIQSNFFAAALAQAMAALPQQQASLQAPIPRQAVSTHAPKLPDAPGWIKQAVQHLKAQPAPRTPAENGVSFPPEDELPMVAALEKALGIPVKAVQGSSAAPAGTRGLILRLTLDAESGTSWRLSDSQIDILVKTKLRPARGTSQLQTLHDCHSGLELGCKATNSSAVKQVLSRWQSSIARQAVELVGQEETDDLFFERGHHSQELVKHVGTGNVGSLFVEAMTKEATSEKDTQVWQSILRNLFSTLKEMSFTEPITALESKLFALDVFLRSPMLQRLLAGLLIEEAAAAAGQSGHALEASAVLAPLLSVSTMPDAVKFLQTSQVTSPVKPFFTSLRRYPTMRGEVDVSMRGLRAALGQAYKAAHAICERLIKLKGTEPVGLGKQAVLAWVAAAAGVNTVRTSGGESKGVLDREPLKRGSSDGFTLGLLAMCLLFCKPFLGGEQKHLDRLDVGYYAQHAYRLPEVQAARTLAGRDNPEVNASFSGRPYVAPAQPGPSSAHFVAECFFLTQRLIHTGLMPAVYRFHQLSDIVYRHKKQQQQQEEDSQDGEEAQSVDMWLLQDSAMAQLMDPQLAAPAVQFLVLEAGRLDACSAVLKDRLLQTRHPVKKKKTEEQCQLAMWLLKLAKQDECAAQRAFACIPDFIIRDMTAWLSFVIRGGQPDLVASCRLDVLIAFLVEMLQRGDLVQSPIIHAKIVELLLTMLLPQPGRRTSRGLLGPSHQGVGEQALVAAVLGTGAAQEQLVPALMKAYAAADYVVGLDVDKDQFDKFGMRHCIDLILLELWKDAACAASLTKLAKEAGEASRDTTFSQYAAAVLNSLVYLLKDSLERLQDIHNIEASMADEASWKALPPRERADKEAFYEGQGSTGGGFMRMALTTLALLNKLSAHPVIKQSFLQPALVGSAAFNCLHFLELLVGPQGVGLKVKEPKKYNFDPKSLLLQICEVLLRLAEDDRFVDGVAGEPDYEEPVLRKAHHILTSKQLGEYEHAARLDKLIAQVAERRQRAAPPGAAAAAVTPSLQQQVTLPDLSFAAPAPSNLEEAYQEAMQPLTVSDFDSSLPGAYNRAFAVMAEQAAGDTQGKMKRLSREMRNLHGKTALPVYMASSVFVRHDSDRMDKVRAMITGPEGTPYHGGCFMFDVFFPQDYPNVPPLMNMATNGEGRARFNPNLYADGKVCLSLLGTWHGTDASQKWDPQTSSLFQILLSIQGMILISDPYFNEPNVERMRGQAEGTKASNSYNAEIHLNNIRWGMIDQLRKLKPGFESVIKAHFRHLRHTLMDQCKAWFEESADLDILYRRRLADAIVELHGLLAAL